MVIYLYSFNSLSCCSYYISSCLVLCDFSLLLRDRNQILKNSEMIDGAFEKANETPYQMIDFILIKLTGISF